MSEPDSVEKTSTPAVDPLPRENPFRAMAQMMRSSAGRLPGHLVVLFAIALSVTILCGVAMKIASSQGENTSALALRIKPEEGKPVLTEAAMRGVWIAQSGESVLTLRVGNGIFEIIYRELDNDLTRYFLRGSYRLEGNVLILQQRKEMGSPYDPANLQLQFYPLEVGSLNLYVDLLQTGMTWRIPNNEMGSINSRDIFTRNALAPVINWIKVSATP